MTDPTTLLDDIHQMSTAIPDVIATLLGPHAIHINSTTHTTTVTSDTLTEILDRKDTLATILEPLTSMAAEWAAMRGQTTLTGSPILYLRANLAWAQARHPAYTDNIHTIKETHTHLARLLTWFSEPTGLTCPTCGQTTTRQVTRAGIQEGIHCPSCEITRTPDEHEALTHLALATHTSQPLTRTETARIFNIHPDRIRQWIHRGQLTETNGKINPADIRQLLH